MLAHGPITTNPCESEKQARRWYILTVKAGTYLQGGLWGDRRLPRVQALTTLRIRFQSFTCYYMGVILSKQQLFWPVLLFEGQTSGNIALDGFRRN